MSRIADNNAENSTFAREFEDYRKEMKERHYRQQQEEAKPTCDNSQTTAPTHEHTVAAPETSRCCAELTSNKGSICADDVLGQLPSKGIRRNSNSAHPSRGLSRSSAEIPANRRGSSDVKFNSSAEFLKKSDSAAQRRNSFDKVLSFCSGVFKKKEDKPNSPKTTRNNEKAKLEKQKKEQDWRMARFIAELEFSGKSDAEIQMHLFHLRDQAQFGSPKSNSVGWLKSMSQAFKDEFSARRDIQHATLHVFTQNPFHAAPPANFAHDLGYSYEDLVALEPVPRSVKSLDHLPITLYQGQELPTSQTSCAICMTDFEKEEQLRALGCSHYFHMECIDKWLCVGTTCPVCKGNVQ